MEPLPTPIERRSLLRTAVWFVRTHVLQQDLLTSRIDPPGITVTGYSKDLLGRHLYKRGVYEPDLSDFVLRRLELAPGQVALDIGANLGWHSLLLAKRFSGVEIHAFEPEPRSFALLQRNIAQNGMTNVMPHASAVGAAKGEMLLYPYPKKNMGRHSLLPIHDAEPIKVQTCRIDDFLSERGISARSLGFVKIDVEGFEIQVLQGGSSLLSSGAPILAEFAPKYIRRGGGDPKLFLSLFRAAGYRPFQCVAGGRKEYTPEELALDQRRDILWIRA